MPSPYKKTVTHRRGGYTAARELQRPARTKAPPVPVTNWPAPVKRWWRAVWVHPVSEEWDVVADLPAVARLGSMYAEARSGKPLTAALMAQMVRLETELLLTPAARKRADVRLPDEESEPTGPGASTVDYRAMLADDDPEARRAARRARILGGGTTVSLTENGNGNGSN